MELRGVNTTRVGTNAWIPRGISGYWDQGATEIDPGWNFWVWLDSDFCEKYYTPLTMQKIKKCVQSGGSSSGSRKIQVMAFELMPIQLAIWKYEKKEFLIRRALKQVCVRGGEFDPPLHIICRALGQLKDLTISAKKDLSIAIKQRYDSCRWSILQQMKEGSMDSIKCKFDPTKEWKCKPALLDVITERHGMADIDLKYVV